MTPRAARRRSWRATILVCTGVLIIAVVCQPGLAYAKKGDDPVPKGHGRTFTVQASDYTAAGGTHRPGKGTVRYEYQVQQVDPCAVTPEGCHGGQLDVCPRRNAGPRDDFVLSLEWRRVVGASVWGKPINLKERGTCINYGIVDPKPVITWQMVRDRVVKVLPKPQWHHQPPHGEVLVIKPMIVRVDTPQDVAFRPFTILGQRVTARAHVKTYAWDFGDHSGSWRYTSPGRAYEDDLPCADAQHCADYVFHSYQQLGVVAIVPTLHWTVQYRVGDADWQTIPADMFTVGAAQRVRLVEAHSVLVAPNH